jgi:CheY-like chemotaxis protein
VCASCGAKLRSKAPAGPSAKGRVAEGASSKPAEPAGRKPAAASAVLENPSATLPPGTPLRPIPKPGSTPLAAFDDDEVAPSRSMPAVADPSAKPAAPAKSAAPKPAASPDESPSSVLLQTLFEEVREVRRVQEEILALLRERPAGRGESGGGASEDPFGFQMDTPVSVPSAAAPMRTRRRKSVLLMDDDAATRQAAVTAFERAEVPVRAVGDGNVGLQMLAEERSDVLVLELGMGGAMGGKDVVNLIKATMEWVDIPIVLYTRLPVAGQKEARQIHGADELVPKASGSEEALVARVIQIFRGRP